MELAGLADLFRHSAPVPPLLALSPPLSFSLPKYILIQGWRPASCKRLTVARGKLEGHTNQQTYEADNGGAEMVEPSPA